MPVGESNDGNVQRLENGAGHSYKVAFLGEIAHPQHDFRVGKVVLNPRDGFRVPLDDHRLDVLRDFEISEGNVMDGMSWTVFYGFSGAMCDPDVALPGHSLG